MPCQSQNYVRCPPIPMTAAQVMVMSRAKEAARRMKYSSSRHRKNASFGNTAVDGLINPSGPLRAICTSRFHNRGLQHSNIGNRCQYVCPRCRDMWHNQIQNAQEDHEQTRREVAQPLIERMKVDFKPAPSHSKGATMVYPHGNVSISTPLPGMKRFHHDSCHIPCESSRSSSLNLRPRKRKRAAHDDNSPRERGRPKTKACVQLLPELLSIIFSRVTDVEPRCALDLLVPDWYVCKHKYPSSEGIVRPTSVVTYTRGMHGNVDTLSKTLRHDDNHHIFLPLKSVDERLVMSSKWCYNEYVRIFAKECTHVFELAPYALPADVAEKSFLDNWRGAFPLRGRPLRDILPFDDECPGTPKRVTPNGATCLFKLVRHIGIRSPLSLMELNARSMVGLKTSIGDANLETLDMAIDLDRASSLWLSWSQMPMLESVLLDLRIYSHDLNTDRRCIGKREIIERAREMGRWLRLNLLVIAGMQSYSFQTSYEPYSAEEIEEMYELDSEPNWIRIFLPALRPGGKLVLVDRLDDLVE